MYSIYTTFCGRHVVWSPPHSLPPSHTQYPVLSKLFSAIVVVLIHLYLSKYFDLEMIIGKPHQLLYYLASSSSLSNLPPSLHPLDPIYSFPMRVFISHMVCISIRCRYYFIWQLVDSISNAAGLGFAGYDHLGRPQWDLVSNMKIWDLETAMSLRTIINSWNVLTSKWLRRLSFIYPSLVVLSMYFLPPQDSLRESKVCSSSFSVCSLCIMAWLLSWILSLFLLPWCSY